MRRIPGGGSPIQCLGLVEVNSRRRKNGNQTRRTVSLLTPSGAQSMYDLSVIDRQLRLARWTPGAAEAGKRREVYYPQAYARRD